MATKAKRYMVDVFIPVQELEEKMNVREAEGYEMIDRRWSGDSVTVVWENVKALFCGGDIEISDP